MRQVQVFADNHGQPYRVSNELKSRLNYSTNHMNIIKWTARSLRTKGPFLTAKIVVNYGADLLFDWRYGTDTMRWVARDAIETKSENLADSQPYKATKSRPFLMLIRQLGLPKDCNFIDIGAGKGRVMLIAAQYGFRKVTGIEFSAPLCAIARKNIERFAAKKNALSPMEVIEADATEHLFAPDDRVLFMFNPFHEKVMERLMQNLRRSLMEHPRSIWLIYNDPLHHATIVQSGLFHHDQEYWVGGTEFRVYTI